MKSLKTQFSFLAAGTLVALTLASCASASPDPSSSEDAAAPAATEAATDVRESATPTPDAPPPVPTCEQMIPDSLIEEFTAVDWTAEASPFTFGEQVLESGIQCTWANYETYAGDNLQIFGWALASDEEAKTAQDYLESLGWIREESGDELYVTENPDFVFYPDDNGYGMTYLFKNGQVYLADTKQGLLLINWPPT